MKQTNKFSLIEILIAVAILGLALGSVLAMFSSSQDQLLRARERWMSQHALEQAAEFYLLSNPSNLEMAEGIMPDGYTAHCEVNAATNVPDHALTPFRGWTLSEFQVSVSDAQGHVVGEITVYKIIREDLFE